MSTTISPPVTRLNSAETPAPAPAAYAAVVRNVATLAWVLLVAATAYEEFLIPRRHANAISYGFIAIGLMYLLSVWITGRMGPFQAAMGIDGRLSTSKFQFLLWTAVVVFTYAWLYAVRAQAGIWRAIDDLPANTLLAMGISVGTLAAAKGITTSYIRSGLVEKPSQAPGAASTSDLVTNDNEAPDLTKIQMLVWTFIAAVVYLANAAMAAKGYNGECANFTRDLPLHCRFPDIDGALMVLMGLGQGAYLGNKLVTISTPRITGVQPVAGAPGTEVKVTGEAFGDTVQTLTLDGAPVQVAAAGWKDGEITFKVPETQPAAGRPWQPRQRVQIGIVTGGRRAVGVAEFQILPPAIDRVEPAQGPKGAAIRLVGHAFGPVQGSSEILLDGARSGLAATWSDEAVAFTLPPTRGAGVVNISLRVGGMESAPVQFTVA